MKRKSFRYLIAILVWGVIGVLHGKNKASQLGLTELVFVDESRVFEGKSRLLEVALWYPADPSVQTEKIEFGIWSIKDAARNARICSDTKLPLIVFSHGYSANQWVNTWFAEHLVLHGYMVAYVRHYGNSYKNMIPELCARPWHRPQDMSFVLDQLLAHPTFGEYIDQDKIGAAGFSQGGIACFWLAGAQASLSQEILKRQITVVNDPALRMLHFKDISTERLQRVLDDFTPQDYQQANRSYKDKRFQAAFIIAPGIDDKNYMFTKQGLKQATMPVYITIGAGDIELLEQAEFFAHNMPNASYTIMSGHITHMTMLNEGTQAGKIKKPEYTLDHPSVNRAQVHRTLALQAVEFFDKCLG